MHTYMHSIYMEYTYEVVPSPKSLQYINETNWREGRGGKGWMQGGRDGIHGGAMTIDLIPPYSWDHHQSRIASFFLSLPTILMGGMCDKK